jgi:very-short-patch-repair endonuclease
MLGTGFLYREHAGVYVVGPRTPVEFGRETAALLACGPGTVLSHLTAAALWKLHPADPSLPIHLSTRRRKGFRAEIVVHQTRHLQRVDVRVYRGLPVTSPARTLVDIARELTDRELERALDETLVGRLARLAEVRNALDRLRARPRASSLRGLLDARLDSSLTRSQLEELFLELIRKAALPEPKVNCRLHGFTVDFYWPEHRVAFETDGYRFHSTRSAFERDRRKDRILKQAGVDMNRVTHAQITGEPFVVVAHVAQRLALVGRRRDAA